MDNWITIIAQNGPAFAILAFGMWLFLKRMIVTHRELEERDAIWQQRIAEKQRELELWQEIGRVNIKVAEQATSRASTRRQDSG